MNPFQKGIKFRSLDDFYDFLPEPELKITLELRKIILGTIPEMKEKLSYNIPFFYLRKNVCYIWPASIPWGNVKLNGVQLGFCFGSSLKDET